MCHNNKKALKKGWQTGSLSLLVELMAGLEVKFNMVKEVLPLTTWVLVPFKEKMMTVNLKLIILLEMVEIWIYITVIAKLLISLVLKLS